MRINPIISENIDDMDLPGVKVILDVEQAEEMGVFEETAISADEAWEACINHSDETFNIINNNKGAKQ